SSELPSGFQCPAGNAGRRFCMGRRAPLGGKRTDAVVLRCAQKYDLQMDSSGGHGDLFETERIYGNGTDPKQGAGQQWAVVGCEGQFGALPTRRPQDGQNGGAVEQPDTGVLYFGGQLWGKTIEQPQ